MEKSQNDDMILKFPEHVGEHDEDDKIVSYCADGEVIWQSEIDAILMGKPIEKAPNQKNPKYKTADSAEKNGD